MRTQVTTRIAAIVACGRYEKKGHQNQRDDGDDHGVDYLRSAVCGAKVRVERGADKDTGGRHGTREAADDVGNCQASHLASLAEATVNAVLGNLRGDERLQDGDEGDAGRRDDHVGKAGAGAAEVARARASTSRICSSA